MRGDRLELEETGREDLGDLVLVRAMDPAQVMALGPDPATTLICSTRRRHNRKVSPLAPLWIVSQESAGSSNTGKLVAAGAVGVVGGVVGGALIANALSDDDYQDGYEAGK